MAYAPTIIDMSRVPPPAAIEEIDFEALYDEFENAFLILWDQLRQADPNLPSFTALTLRSEPVGIVGEAASAARLRDRARVNDAYRALLAPLAKGSNLEVIAAGRNIARLVVIPATETAPAVMEGDESLLRRYLQSYDRPAAGSRDRYLYEAATAWPQSPDKTLGLWDARVNGFEVHGRRGDTDVVIIGPFGRLPTEAERKLIRDAVTKPNTKPDAVSVAVLPASRVEYSVALVIEVPGVGPAPEAIRVEVENRIIAAARDRIRIGGEIPAGLMSGAAYGDNVIKVRDLAPVAIEPDPYKVPVMASLSVAVEVRG